MANQGLDQTIKTFDASGDISGNLDRAVILDSNDEVAIPSSAGDSCIGILKNEPTAQGNRADVVIHGFTQAEAGGSINAMDPIATAADGQVVTATRATVDTTTSNSSQDVAGDHVIGTALKDAGSAGDKVEVFLMPLNALVT